jgi:hypothetical protein
MYQEDGRHAIDCEEMRNKEEKIEVTPMAIGQYQRHAHEEMLVADRKEEQGTKWS